MTLPQNDVLSNIIFRFQKNRLRRPYGNNYKTARKIEVLEELTKERDFKVIAVEMNIALAMAEVYGIDSFAASAPLDETMLARFLDVSRRSFLVIKDAITRNSDGKLRSVRDELKEQLSYSQIKFIIGCLLRDLEL